MKYEGISFNTKAILELKQDQFVKRFSYAWPKVEKKVREDRLKEVYKLAKIHENAK